MEGPSQSMADPQKIHPVILAGGSGQRLWPLSRPQQPKPFLKLTGDLSLLQLTARRFAENQRFTAPLVICGHQHRFVVGEQLQEIGCKAQGIVLEPVSRNTAPAVCTAALLVAETDPDSLLLLLPSDHFIRSLGGFLETVEGAIKTATDGWIVTFGALPDRPETGYGYIQKGEPLATRGGGFRIEQFVEKPDRETAKRYLQDGRYSWNSGMFLSTAGLLLEEIGRYEPEVLNACQAALSKATVDEDFLRLEEAAFALQPDLSFDYAVMEHTDRGAVVPFDVGWSDAGTWDAIYQIAEKDGDGNVLTGTVLATETRASYLRAEGPPIATLGVDGLIVVSTGDMVLVCPRDQSQKIARVIDRISADSRFAILDKPPLPEDNS